MAPTKENGVIISSINLIKTYIKDIFKSLLIKNGIFIFLNIFLVTPINFAFWIMASRLFSPEIVGVSASLIGIISILSIIGRFGFENGLKRFLPESGKQKTVNLINYAFSTVIISSFPVFSIFLVVFYFLSHNFPIWVWTFPEMSLLFILFIFTNIGTLFDSVSMGLRKTKYSLFRVLLAGILRFLMFFIGYKLGPMRIIFSFSLAAFLSSLISFFLLFPKMLPEYKFRIFLGMEGKIILEYSLKHYFFQFSSNFADQILPTIVLLKLSESNAAYFSIGHMFVLITLFFPKSISQSFLIESVKFPSNIKSNLLISFIFIGFILTCIIVFFALFGNYILGWFGTDYKVIYLYVILGMIAALPYTLNEMYYNYCKIRRKMLKIIILNGIYVIILLSLTVVFVSTYGLKIIGILMILENIFLNIVTFFLVRKDVKDMFIRIKNNKFVL